MALAQRSIAPVRRGVFLTVATAALLAAAMLIAGPVAAQSGGDGPAYDEAEAQAIDRMLMCPVCPAQTIDQTEVPLAKQMRARVRELLAEGATRQEVLAWFAAPERYGPSVLAEPPRSGFNLIAWIVPGVAVLAALIGGTLILRAMRRPAPESAPPVSATAAESAQASSTAEPSNAETPTAAGAPSAGAADDLQPYLAAVDRELALDADADADRETGDG